MSQIDIHGGEDSANLIVMDLLHWLYKWKHTGSPRRDQHRMTLDQNWTENKQGMFLRFPNLLLFSPPAMHIYSETKATSQTKGYIVTGSNKTLEILNIWNQMLAHTTHHHKIVCYLWQLRASLHNLAQRENTKG